MTRNEAELKIEFVVNDFCKGFAGYVDEELISALMVLLDSDFSTVQKHVPSKVNSYDRNDNGLLEESHSFGGEKILWFMTNDQSD
jgi:hypothetical protein